MFVLTSDITIGKFRFAGVNDVRIKRSIHGIAETAVISIPSIARILYKGKATPGTVITGAQFKDGDAVTIKLGYNGEMQTEFRGFVKRRNLQMPLVVECEGYSWLLRRNSVDRFWKKISVKELLKAAVAGLEAGYRISVQCDVDLELNNVSLAGETGFDVITNLSKYTDNGLTCFFIRPDTLWCGLLYSNYAQGSNPLQKNTVKYRLGYNVVSDNDLRERNKENGNTLVKYSKRMADGNKISETSDAFKNYARTHTKILNRVRDSIALKRLANEHSYQLSFTGYEGHLKTFLQPFAEPGYNSSILDTRYPERDGTYLVESTEVIFGMSGARRIVEIGPRLGFAKEL